MIRRLALGAALLALVAGCGTPADLPAAQVAPVTAEAPPIAAPVSITIPSLRITDELVPVGLCAKVVPVTCPDGKGEMELPPVTETGWYRLGPKPGEAGRAVIAGHVNYEGVPGALGHLPAMKVGDLVTTTAADGVQTSFTVYASHQIPKARYAAETVPLVFSPTGARELALITCSGKVVGHDYLDNTVVLLRAL